MCRYLFKALPCLLFMNVFVAEPLYGQQLRIQSKHPNPYHKYKKIESQKKLEFVNKKLVHRIISTHELNELNSLEIQAGLLSARYIDLSIELDNALISKELWKLKPAKSPLTKQQLKPSPTIEEQIQKATLYYNNLQSEYAEVISELTSIEESIEEKYTALSSKIKNTSLNKNNIDWSTSVAVALFSVSANFRRTLLAIPHNETHEKIPHELKTRAECEGDLIADSVLWQYFYAASQGKYEQASALAQDFYRLLSCTSLMQLFEYDIAFQNGLDLFESLWKEDENIFDLSIQILAQPLYSFLDLTNRFGPVSALIWFQKMSPKLISLLSNNKATFLKKNGLILWNKYEGKFAKLIPDCSNENSPHCRSLIDFIESIGNPLAWGIGGCSGIDLLRSGSVGNSHGLEYMIQSNYDLSEFTNQSGEGMLPPIFSCDNGCQNSLGTSSQPNAFQETVQLAREQMVNRYSGFSNAPTSSAFAATCAMHGGKDQDMQKSGGALGGPGLGGILQCLLLESAMTEMRNEANCVVNAAKHWAKKQSALYAFGPTHGCSIREGSGTDDSKSQNTGKDIEPAELDESDKKKLDSAKDKATTDKKGKETQEKLNEGIKKKHVVGKNLSGKDKKITINSSHVKKGTTAAKNVKVVKSLPNGKAGNTKIENGKIVIYITEDAVKNYSDKDLQALIEHELAHAILAAAELDYKSLGISGVTSFEVDALVEGKPGKFNSHHLYENRIGHTIFEGGKIPQKYPDSGSLFWDSKSLQIKDCMDPEFCSGSCSGSDELFTMLDDCVLSSDEHITNRNKEQRKIWGKGNIDPHPHDPNYIFIDDPSLQCIIDGAGGNTPSGDPDCMNVLCPEGQSAQLSDGQCTCGHSTKPQVGAIPSEQINYIDCGPNATPVCEQHSCRCVPYGGNYRQTRSRQAGRIKNRGRY